MNETKLETGYYWARFSNGWHIVLFEHPTNLWFFMGVGGSIDRWVILEIDERKITRP